MHTSHSWQTMCCCRRREMLLPDVYNNISVACGQSAAETFVKMTRYVLTLTQQTGTLDNCTGCKSTHTLLLCRVYFKRGVQPKCGVQDEKCGVQNWKMCSPIQNLYTSRNSLFWALTHLIQIQWNLNLHSSSFHI